MGSLGIAIGPVTREDYQAAREGGLGESRRLVGDLHCRLSDFIHRVVVHRGDVAITAWRNWFRSSLLVDQARFGAPCSLLAVSTSSYSWWFRGSCGSC